MRHLVVRFGFFIVGLVLLGGGRVGQAQTTNLWAGPTNAVAAGSWTNAANWSPDVPDADTEVASFTADFFTNFTVTLDAAVTVNGLIYNDIGSSKQTLAIAAGTPPGQLLFAGANPFASIVSATEGAPMVIQSAMGISSFTKQGSGWLRLTNLASNELPAAVNVTGGALYLDEAGSNVVVAPWGFTKAGPAQLLTGYNSPLLGDGNVVVNDGRFEVRKGSTNFNGAITVNSNGVFISRGGPYSEQYGSTSGVTTVNGNGQAKFQDPTPVFTCNEVFNLKGFRADGSLQMDFAEGTLGGAINLGTNSHIGINTFNHVIRHTRMAGVIDDGPATNGVTFTIGYGGALPTGTDTQYLNYVTASRFILSGSNTYGGPTYVTVRNGSTVASNLTLTVELTNGPNRLPATTVLTLGGIPPGIAGHAAANGRLKLDGVDQTLAGLVTSGTGANNRVVSGSEILCTLTLNTVTGPTYTFAGSLGGPNANEDNLAVIKKGAGLQVFSGASTFTGQVYVAAGMLEVAHSAALGATNGNTVVTNGAQLRLSGNSAIHDELILVGSGIGGSNLGVLRSMSGTNSVNGPITFTGGVLGRIQNSGASLALNGGLTASNLTVMLAPSDGTIITVASNPVNVGTATLQAHDPGTLYLNVAGNVMGTFNPAWSDTAVIGASNALPANVVLDIGMSSIYATSGSGKLDLNGFDVACSQLKSSYSNGVSNPYNLLVRNSSTTSAALIVNQATNSLYDGRLAGNLALVKDGSGRLTLAGSNTHAGVTVVSNGLLVVNGRSEGTGDVQVISGTLGGTGLLAGAVSGAGTVSPGASIGRLNLGSGYAQGGAGSLVIELGGLTPETEHDVLAVAGAAQLDGTLSAVLTNSFAPALGHSFTVLTAAAVSGPFATTNLPTLSSGLVWQVDYASNALVLGVVLPLTGYDAWSNSFVLAQGPEGDDDGDGYANLLEYATGGHPTTGDAVARMGGRAAAGLLSMTFNRDTNATDVSYFVEGADAATNGAPWSPVATCTAGSWGGAPNVSEGMGNPLAVTVTDTDGPATNRYLRLRVTRP